MREGGTNREEGGTNREEGCGQRENRNGRLEVNQVWKVASWSWARAFQRDCASGAPA